MRVCMYVQIFFFYLDRGLLCMSTAHGILESYCILREHILCIERTHSMCREYREHTLSIENTF